MRIFDFFSPEKQRLRNENRLLKKQNELLEAESTELAHRLVRGQVSRAEEEETAFAIQSELLALRKSHLELSHQLETANEEIRGLSLRLQENVRFMLGVTLGGDFHVSRLSALRSPCIVRAT